jgi:hypothetical protein
MKNGELRTRSSGHRRAALWLAVREGCPHRSLPPDEQRLELWAAVLGRPSGLTNSFPTGPDLFLPSYDPKPLVFGLRLCSRAAAGARGIMIVLLPINFRSRPGHFLKMGLFLAQLLIAQLFRDCKAVPGSLCRDEQFIELCVNRLAVTILSVLDEENHQKGDDCRSRVNNQLPGVGKLKEGACDPPNYDDHHGKKECRDRPRQIGYRVREPAKDIVHALSPAQDDKRTRHCASCPMRFSGDLVKD